MFKGFLGIPFFNALNSGNFSSTTSEKSSFLDTDLVEDFENIEQQDEVQRNSLHFFTFLDALERTLNQINTRTEGKGIDRR